MKPDSPSDPEPSVLPLVDGAVGYTDEGEGPTLVAVHGLPGSVRDYRWLGAALGPGVRLVRVELPGFGSSVARPDRSLAGRAAVVLRAMDALGLDRVVVMGHSMGGPVATALAAMAPDRVRGLALLASAGPRPHRTLRELPLPPRLIAWLLRAPTGRWLLPTTRAIFEKAGFRGISDEHLVETFRQVASTSFRDHAHNLEALRVPTLVAWTADDRQVEDAVGEALYWAAPSGPRIRFPDGGHNLQKTRSVELAEALLAWERTLP